MKRRPPGLIVKIVACKERLTEMFSDADGSQVEEPTALSNSKAAPWWMIYFLIALPVILFNLVAIWGPQVLLADDAGTYYHVTNGSFPSHYLRQGLALCSITEWMGWNIMAISPYLIRAIYVVILMVPLAWLIFRLFHKVFGMPVIVAYAIAILPNILPAQFLIPSFTNGSYILIGLIAILGGLFTGFNYLQGPPDRAWLWLVPSVVLMAFSTQLMDQAVFFLPVWLVGIVGYTKFSKRHLILASIYIVVLSYKLIWIILFPRGAAQAVSVPLPEMLSRFYTYFLGMLPFPHFSTNSTDVFSFFGASAVVVVGVLLNVIPKARVFPTPSPLAHLSPRLYALYLYGFLLTWTGSTLFVYVTMSRYRAVRYSYIAAYGFNALLILAVYAGLTRLLPNTKKVITAIFVCWIIVSGIARLVELEQRFHPHNALQARLKAYLAQFDFPAQAQIVIYLQSPGRFYGPWIPSSGYLRFALKRKDIDGLIGTMSRQYFNFYDPFNPERRNWNQIDQMRGLTTTRPVYLFVEREKGLEQFGYALKWEREGDAESPWTILRIDKRFGNVNPLVSGKGRSEYTLTLDRLAAQGIHQADILWGGGPKQN